MARKRNRRKKNTATAATAFEQESIDAEKGIQVFIERRNVERLYDNYEFNGLWISIRSSLPSGMPYYWEATIPNIEGQSFDLFTSNKEGALLLMRMVIGIMLAIGAQDPCNYKDPCEEVTKAIIENQIIKVDNREYQGELFQDILEEIAA